uniref:Uncharacterized protein n=1 Tax=Nonomuraea gerenzanensis TaxID=93944 RepID=A0A1M4EF89_9ACTN|nr:hypothetical protein BN4615_P6759 [Nonomuraea gerenzanensis]
MSPFRPGGRGGVSRPASPAGGSPRPARRRPTSPPHVPAPGTPSRAARRMTSTVTNRARLGCRRTRTEAAQQAAAISAPNASKSSAPIPARSRMKALSPCSVGVIQRISGILPRRVCMDVSAHTPWIHGARHRHRRPPHPLPDGGGDDDRRPCREHEQDDLRTPPPQPRHQARPRPTASAAGSSATCTTAPSSGSSRRPCSRGSPSG